MIYILKFIRDLRMTHSSHQKAKMQKVLKPLKTISPNFSWQQKPQNELQTLKK
jgi:hypothetical protein